MPSLNREGSFRGSLSQWGVAETKNGAVEFTGKVLLDEEWYEATPDNEANWYGINDGPLESYIHVVLVTKNKAINPSGIDQMNAAFNWSGNWEELAPLEEGGVDWSQVRIQCRARNEEYQGKTSTKIVWVSGADDPVGGGIKSMAMGEIKGLAAHWGSQTRGMLGGSAPVPPPPGKPKAPPAKPEAAPAGDEIPF